MDKYKAGQGAEITPSATVEKMPRVQVDHLPESTRESTKEKGNAGGRRNASVSDDQKRASTDSVGDDLFWPGPWGKDSMLVLQQVVRRFEATIHKGGALLVKGQKRKETGGSTTRREKPRTKEKKKGCRVRTHELFSNPDSSKVARAINSFILSLIVISSVSFVLETVPIMNEGVGQIVFESIEYFCIVIFTFEYVIRICTTSSVRTFITSVSNAIDLIAIVPFYVELGLLLGSGQLPFQIRSEAASSSGLASTRIIRVLRLARVFRVLKLGKAFGKIQLVGKALRDSSDVMGMLVFLFAISIILCSSLIYFVEKGELDPDGFYYRDDGSKSLFTSIPEAMWWSIVTMMSVGYGDMVPVTTIGKLIGCLLSFLSMGVLALPISIIGANFQQLYSSEQRKRRAEQQKENITSSFQKFRDNLAHHSSLMQDVLLLAKMKHSILMEYKKNLVSLLSYIEMGGKRGINQKVVSKAKFLLKEAEFGATELESIFQLSDLIATDEFQASLQQCGTEYKKLSQVEEEVHLLNADIERFESIISDLEATTTAPRRGGSSLKKIIVAAKRASISLAALKERRKGRHAQIAPEPQAESHEGGGGKGEG
uniref:Ion transport domain-containing protein n=2 Tax=Palpitomonas bilix TaxID=652834 RepID=A0A7S3G4A9_9EUKA|mmetsp:Transcript_20721/g.53451  ORF Transcript_20721/g.53451 Transcript_20721/m.53451 type:complete len:598 (+) Transcript_20721:226-2019(+)|eukprot:CAMPEP_0113874998 /NCGR_PEP_ID=MMETSP0780_2-20120614/4672_1 /TAXON_ID=652834 /ORGANISM="Palpitomonas bilix" /LENGTH=597 /DNA_ID=CAMNT_0000860887 /DNA_START=270 /DNA_END=2063 /DNA_ORIENTATION=+ /assembly_acc=CAM_ASM_000599